MAKINVNNIGAASPDALVDARLQLHFATEWVARVGRFLVPPRADYSHISLGWDDALGALSIYPLPNGTATRLALNLSQFKIVAVENGGASWELPLEGLTHKDLGRNLEQRMNELGLDGAAIHKDIPYTLSHPRLSQGGAYSSSGITKELAALEAWFAVASTLLEEERQWWHSVKPGASSVRCWPHHFDIATLVTLDEGDAETARSIGFGLSPGDEAYSQPYVYVNPWPRPADVSNLPTPPRGAIWHTEGFFSLLLPTDEIVAAGDPLEFMRSHLKAGRELAARVINYPL